MSDPKDMILPLLREIREEMRTGFSGLRTGQTTLEGRMQKLEQRFDNLREALNGESILGRYAVAEVEDRLEKIEKRLDTLEGRR